MSLRDRLEDAVARAAMVEQELLDPRTVRDAKLFATLGREHQRLQDVVHLAGEVRQLERELEESREMAGGDDADFAAEAQEEVARIEARLEQLDADLRPEGKQGPLVRTLASHRAYYERWARTWEYQALLKARPVAGDRALGDAYVTAMNPMVWAAVRRENFVADSQAMRRRVEEYVPAAEADRQLKLGVGGLRDVEFTVQLLQLVHGRADESIRIDTAVPRAPDDRVIDVFTTSACGDIRVEVDEDGDETR